MTKPNPNVRRLDRIYDEYEHAMSEYIGGLGKPNPGTFGQFSSRRGVLAVCAATVPRDARDGITACYPVTVLDYLRRLARGVR